MLRCDARICEAVGDAFWSPDARDCAHSEADSVVFATSAVPQDAVRPLASAAPATFVSSGEGEEFASCAAPRLCGRPDERLTPRTGARAVMSPAAAELAAAA